MKYLTLDGKIAACEPLESIFRNSDGGGPEDFCLAQPSSHVFMDIHECIGHIMRILSSKPKYLSENDIPWILAYVDDFRVFCTKEDMCWSPYGHYQLARNYIHHICYSERDQSKPAEHPDFISLTRTFVALDIIASHLHGFDVHVDCIIGHPGVITNKSLSNYSKDEGFMAEIWIDGIAKFSNNKNIEFYRDSIDFMHEKSFKTEMSQIYFKRARGKFKIPHGMGLAGGEDNDDDNQLMPSGYSSEFEIDRFYLTNGSWRDNYISELNPMIPEDKLQLGSRFDEPIYRCYLREEGVTRRDRIVNIPFSWITHSYGSPSSYLSASEKSKEVKSHRA